jgi:hypothetical protein
VLRKMREALSTLHTQHKVFLFFRVQNAAAQLRQQQQQQQLLI